jgi:hypothetical protein
MCSSCCAWAMCAAAICSSWLSACALEIRCCTVYMRPGGVCTHIPDAPNHLCVRMYQITEVRKLP